MKNVIVVRPSLDDGWRDPFLGPAPLRASEERALRIGDTVLYRTVVGGTRQPAVLIGREGNGWLARGTRRPQQRIYLAPQSIAEILPRNDLLGEAA